MEVWTRECVLNNASYARSVAHRSSRPAHSELEMFGPLTVLTEHLSHSAEE